MKRYIKANVGYEEAVPDKNGLYRYKYKYIVPRNRHEYRVDGSISEEMGIFFAQITKIVHYDLQDYWWARVNGGGLIEYIDPNGHVKETQEFKEFDEDKYEFVREYADEMVEAAVNGLEVLNAKLNPIIDRT